MLKRVITSIFIIACVLPPLIYGGWLLAILISLIVGFGSYEMLSLNKNYSNWPVWLKAVYAIILIVTVITSNLRVKISLAILMVLLLFSLPVFEKRLKSSDAIIATGVFGLFTLFATAFTAIYNYNSALIFFVIITTYLTDTGAFFTGYFLGKHKLNERISPNKTIEGAIGGYLFGSIAGFISLMVIFKGINNIALPLIVATLTLPIISQIGDLAFSAIKREYDVKDFSNIFPGHGGFLDRVDSLVFNLIAFLGIMMVL